MDVASPEAYGSRSRAKQPHVPIILVLRHADVTDVCTRDVERSVRRKNQPDGMLGELSAAHQSGRH